MAELSGKPISESISETAHSPLAEWFDSIVDTPLVSFTVGDLARSIRQDLFPDYLVPYSLQYLQSEPRAGFLYEGELLIALGFVPADYWKVHEEHRLWLLRLIDFAIQSDNDGELTSNTIERLLAIQEKTYQL
jgi:hypothetical protein